MSAFYRRVRTLTLTTLLALLHSGFAGATSSPALGTDHLISQLVAAVDHVVPGQPLQLGLLLQHDEHWHTYWKNPGDSGLPTTIELTLPAGFEAGAIAWPLPERLPVGTLMNFGYSNTALLPLTVQVPAQIAAASVTITAKAEWLICREECIPGAGSYSLTLPVAAAAQPVAAWADAFAQAQRRQPQSVPDLRADYRIDGADVLVHIAGADAPADLPEWTLFPATPELIANAAKPSWRREGDGWQARIAKNEYFAKAPAQFELLLTRAERGIEIQAALSTHIPAAANPGRSGLLPAALLLAALGGLLLNLMPCVFPVLFLKAASALEAAADRRKLRRHSLLYAAGVVASFLAVAGALLFLRASGAALGWGFQLQEPRFVAAMALLIFIMALAFSGLVEIGARFAGIGQRLTEGSGNASAFFTGVLACVVASPCTAPFMGTALGFALLRPPVEALAVFAALGLGMALPMLALGFVPGLARLLPRPGAWMATFRQFLAFPLYLTAVWLVWVYGEQTSTQGMAELLVALTAVAFALWLLARAGSGWRGRSVGALALVTLLAAGAWPLLQTPASAGAATGGNALAEPWSQARLAELRNQGRPVLVNMTAAWCITCLANERVALSSPHFAEVLAAHNTAYLKGDWTRRDAHITAYLESFGRSGVPLYVLYPPDPAGEPVVLPQILTAGAVEAALNAL